MTNPDPALLDAAVAAHDELKRAGDARDNAIRAANGGGHSVRAISAAIEATGAKLSASRVGQIIQEGARG